MRLDHADFEDVSRTIYAVGTVTDVEKDADDPMTAKSRVKVKIGDGDPSGFIPIFFHPKNLYWDGPGGIKATDYDVDEKLFKRAWMSFRYGDEVAVLLRADPTNVLEPYAAVAFADGVPRIGENCLKITYPNTSVIKALPPGAYPAGDTGPDGLDLKLVTDCERLVEGETVAQITFTIPVSCGDTYGNFNQNIYQLGRWFWILTFTRYLWFADVYAKNYNWIYRYLIPIGPILFVLRTNTRKTDLGSGFSAPYVYSSSNEQEGPQLPGYGSEEDAQAACNAEQAILAAATTHEPLYTPQTIWGGVSTPDEVIIQGAITLFQVYAAINNEDAQAAARNLSQWPPAGFIAQWNGLGAAIGFDDVAEAQLDLGIKVRPHTKAELQAADMWPPEE